MIIDPHAHIFPRVQGINAVGPTRGAGYGRIWIGNQQVQLMPALNEETKFTPEMLIANMDWGTVDKTVLLQSPFYGECNQYTLDAVGQYPDRLIGVAYLDPWSPKLHDAFDKIVDFPLFRAVKMECSEATGFCGIHPESKLDNSEISWLWAELEHRGLVLVLDLGTVASRSYQTDAVRAIANKHPNPRIVIAHLGQPNPMVEANPSLLEMWLAQIDLGKLANVWLDNAALPAYWGDEGYPYPSAARYTRTVIERIGPNKVMWGTDIPGLFSHLMYLQLVSLAKQHTEFLNQEEQAMVLGGNAMEVYG